MKTLTSFLNTTLVVSVAVMALLMTTAPGLVAHDDSMPGQGQIPPHARDNMRAFHEDHHHDENLPAQGITACDGGLAGTYPCSNIDLMAFLPLAQIGGGNGNDIWGWTDPLTGKEFAIMGLTNGTAFVDISDPVNPVYYGHLPPPAGVSNSSWRDIKVYADHAFIGSEAVGSGMQVFDLTILRDGPSLVDGFVETAHYTGFSTSHNIVVNEDTGFAYGVGVNNDGCSRGIQVRGHQRPRQPAGRGLFRRGRLHPRRAVRDLHGPRRHVPGQGNLLRLQRRHADHRRRDQQGGAGAGLANGLRQPRLHPPGLADRGPRLPVAG